MKTLNVIKPGEPVYVITGKQKAESRIVTSILVDGCGVFYFLNNSVYPMEERYVYTTFEAAWDSSKDLTPEKLEVQVPEDPPRYQKRSKN